MMSSASSCCSCDCRFCGLGGPSTTVVFVCSFVGCEFRAQDLNAVRDHKKEEHGPKTTLTTKPRIVTLVPRDCGTETVQEDVKFPDDFSLGAEDFEGSNSVEVNQGEGSGRQKLLLSQNIKSVSLKRVSSANDKPPAKSPRLEQDPLSISSCDDDDDDIDANKDDESSDEDIFSEQNDDDDDDDDYEPESDEEEEEVYVGNWEVDEEEEEKVVEKKVDNEIVVPTSSGWNPVIPTVREVNFARTLTHAQAGTQKKHQEKDNSILVCAILACRFMATDVGILRRHMNDRHFSGVNFARDLNGHCRDWIAKEEGKRMEKWICRKCDFKSGFQTNVEVHVSLVHLPEIGTAACLLCPFVAGHTELLKNHALERHRSKTIERSGQSFACPKCESEAGSLLDLNQHMKCHKKCKELKCEECNFVTSHSVILRRHLVQSHQQRPEQRFKCEECDYTCEFRSQLVEHRQRVHGTLLCGIQGCQFSAQNPLDVKNHRRLQHFTGEAFSSDLNGHCRTLLRAEENDAKVERGKWNPKRKYFCRVCDYMSVTSTNAEVHVSTKHLPEVRPVMCPMCPDRFGHTKFLKLHVRTKHFEGNSVQPASQVSPPKEKVEPDENNHILPAQVIRVQKTTTNAQQSCNNTKKSSASISLHQCMECKFATSSFPVFQAHQRSHQISKVIKRKCEVCNFVADSNFHWKCHQQIHPTESFNCNLCDFATLKRQTWHNHRTSHAQKVVHPCDLCDYSTFQGEHLARHKRVIHGPFQCSVPGCSFEAGSPKELMDHRIGAHFTGESFDKSLNDHCKTLLRIGSGAGVKSSRKMHFCTACDFKSFVAENAEVHVSTNHLAHVKPVSCPHCPKMYGHTKILKVHVRKAHCHQLPGTLSRQSVRNQTTEETRCVEEIEGRDVNNGADDVGSSTSGIGQTMENIQELQFNPMDPAPDEVKTEHNGHIMPGCSQQQQQRTLNHLQPSDRETSPTLKKCTKCEFQTSILSIYQKHRKSHIPYKTTLRRCEACCFLADSPFLWEDHQRIHHNEGYKCKQCNFSTLAKRSWYNHKQKHTQKVEHICDLCDYSTTIKERFERHRRVIHGPFQCSVPGCSFEVATSKELKTHRIKEHFTGDAFDKSLDVHCKNLLRTEGDLGDLRSRKMHFCTVCDYRSDVGEDAEVHVSVKHLAHVKPVLCPHCPSKFGHTKLLKVHVRRTHCHRIPGKKSRQMCRDESATKTVASATGKIVDLITTNNEAIDKEVIGENVRNPIQFRCDQCKIEMSTFEDFERHLRQNHQQTLPASHLGEKSESSDENSRTIRHKCDQCQFETYISEEYDIHQQINHKQQSANLLNHDDEIEITESIELKSESETLSTDDCGLVQTNAELPTSTKNVPKDDVNLDQERTECDDFKKSQDGNSEELEKRQEKQPSPSKIVHSAEDSSSTFCYIQGCQFQTPIPNTMRSHRREKHYVGDCFKSSLNSHCRKLLIIENDNNYKKIYCCLKCDFKSNNTTNSEVHVATQHCPDIRRAGCPICPAQLTHTRLLKVHIKTVHREIPGLTGQNRRSLKHLPPLSCHQCDYTTNVGSQMQEHLDSAHHRRSTDEEEKASDDDVPTKNQPRIKENTSSSKLLHCPRCDDFETHNREELRVHKREVHGKLSSSVFLCDLCGFKATTRQHIVRHKNAHHGSFLCEKCDFQTCSEHKFRFHKRCAHRVACPDCRAPVQKDAPEEEHRCPATKMGPGAPDPAHISMIVGSTDNRLVKNRLVKKLSDDSYLCLPCGLRDTSLAFVRRHVKLVHSDFYCEKCDFKTTLRPALLKHVKYEHDLKCESCGKSFREKSEMDKHCCSSILVNGKRATKNDELATCPECKYVPSNVKNLARHVENVHRGVKRAHCDLCGRGFTDRGTLGKHVRLKHMEGQERFHCTMCDFRTHHAGSLKGHLLTHKWEEMACEFEGCGFKTTAMGTMNRHKREKHPRQLEKKKKAEENENVAAVDE